MFRVMIMRKLGTDMRMSTIRIMKPSTSLPEEPLTMPYTVPNTMEMSMDRKPTSRETRPP